MKNNLENKKLFDTHKLFYVNEFIYDDVNKTIDEKLENYRDKFLPNHDEKNVTSDNGMWLMIVPLIEELKFYYNNDICFSIALSIAISEGDRFNLRTHSYYYENALFRIESAWKYLFIVLNEFLQTGLAIGVDVKEALIEAGCHKIDFVKHSKDNFNETEIKQLRSIEKIDLLKPEEKTLGFDKEDDIFETEIILHPLKQEVNFVLEKINKYLIEGAEVREYKDGPTFILAKVKKKTY